MNKIVFLFVTVLLFAIFACTTDDEAAPSEYVIEGWIENDAYPIVKLTRSIPISEDYQPLDSLEQYVARWERITISDGEQTVTLTGQMDRRYMPPYIYTTTDLKGKAGRTYTFTLHQEGGAPDIIAETTIPEPVRIDSFYAEPIGTSDTLCQLFAHVSIPKWPVTYYRLFTQTGSQSQDFLPSYLGLLRSDMIPDDGRIVVNKGITNLEKNYSPYFSTSENVVVRFARIDSLAYEYWRAHEDIVMLARNPLFPVTTSMPRTIPHAYGFWQGMGSVYYMVPLRSYIRTIP